jgi:hypothetical protein
VLLLLLLLLLLLPYQGKTHFQQKKECCAGSLEGRFLKMMVAATGGVGEVFVTIVIRACEFHLNIPCDIHLDSLGNTQSTTVVLESFQDQRVL